MLQQTLPGCDGNMQLGICLLLLLLLHPGTLPCSDLLSSLRLAWLVQTIGWLAAFDRCCLLQRSYMLSHFLDVSFLDTLQNSTVHCTSFTFAMHML